MQKTLLNYDGINEPYTYFGTKGTVFCIVRKLNFFVFINSYHYLFLKHCEDKNFGSINYLHNGSAKIWYAVRPVDSDIFYDKVAPIFSKKEGY